MNPLRSTASHVVLLVLGGVAASYAFTKDRTPQAAQETNVTVWTGRAADVQRIVYETKDKKIELESREEKKSPRWFLGKGDYNVAPLVLADGGAPAPQRKQSVFASVALGTKIAESLVPLKAVRALGKIPDGRLTEFGFEKKDVSLTVTVSGKEHKLIVGATAPGGTDTYVIDPTNSEAYVVKSEPIRDLDGGDSRLLEHDLHAFKDFDIRSAKVTASGKTRDLVRGGPDNKKVWADPSDKDKADETAANWLAKIDRLKISEFTAKLPEGYSVVVRVEYIGAPGTLGFFELAKGPPVASNQKGDYFITTEHTHLWGKVYQVSAEQIEQDSGSVVK